MKKLYLNFHKSVPGVERSATRMIYIKTNVQVERWSKITDFVISVFIPTAFMWPKPTLCFYLYFATDLGNDVFELTFPIW